MSARFEFGEKFIEVSNFCFHTSEAERGNPYNTTFSLVVQSCGFHGVAPCEYDIKSFKAFLADLHSLYNFKTDKAILADICYGSKVLFTMDRAGHVEVSGKIYGDYMIHALEFCFAGDQTVLKLFLESLDEMMYRNCNF